jgi:hypothetical protein
MFGYREEQKSIKGCKNEQGTQSDRAFLGAGVRLPTPRGRLRRHSPLSNAVWLDHHLSLTMARSVAPFGESRNKCECYPRSQSVVRGSKACGCLVGLVGQTKELLNRCDEPLPRRSVLLVAVICERSEREYPWA